MTDTDIEQRTPEWIEARRTGVTGTDIPALLGLSPYLSEGDVARSKGGAEDPPTDPESERRMRIGRLMEHIVALEDIHEHGIPIQRVPNLQVHPTIPWAMASLDYERPLDGTIVEMKTSKSRRWDDGILPEVEAQVQWQLGVTQRASAHVAVLRYGSELQCFDLEARPDDFAGMVVIAEDFRRRLALGGPFSETRRSIGRAFPFDDGTEMIADEDMARLVVEYLEAKQRLDAAGSELDDAALGIKTRMGLVSRVIGNGFKVTWKRSKDTTVTDWDLIAHSYRYMLEDLNVSPETLDAVKGLYTRQEQGRRPLLVRLDRK